MPTPIPISKEFLHGFYKPIQASTHKGLQGHALLIGGSYGKIGAVVLASKAALKSGCGLVTSFVPRCGYTILQTANPEVMVLTDEAEKHLSNIIYDIQPQAIGIGMGMGQDQATAVALHKFLKINNHPLLVDADALNLLAHNRAWLSLMPKHCVLTPHPKELERLIGTWDPQSDMIDKTMAFAQQYQCIVVMKSAITLVTDGTSLYQNTTGNAALATAGSGDVLAGIITSLLAQSYSGMEAAALGVYLHGLTATIGVSDTGYQSFIASDCIAYLGKAYLSFENN